MLFCKLDDGFSCNSSIIATKDAAFNSFQFEARGPMKSGEQRSIVDALYAWKPGQSTLQQLGVKALIIESLCFYTPEPNKPTNLLALHATLGAQFAHTSLSRFVQYPGPVHMQAVLRVLAYLRGTIDQCCYKCLVFTRPGIASIIHTRLWGWVDADYAGCQDTRRSHTGYVLMLNGAAISWRSKRQATVSLSSAESEFIAASQCGQEVVYLREILQGFGAEQENCTRVFEDNQACIAMSENTVHRERSRHIDVRKYYVRELVEDKLIKLMPCGTKEMTADALTKSLPYPSFRTHRNTMLDATSQQKMLETTSLRASACWTWT